MAGIILLFCPTDQIVLCPLCDVNVDENITRFGELAWEEPALYGDPAPGVSIHMSK